MHCKGMHLTFCYAALELAWQKAVLELLNMVCGARWWFFPQRIERLFFFSLLFCPRALLCVSQSS